MPHGMLKSSHVIQIDAQILIMSLTLILRFISHMRKEIVLECENFMRLNEKLRAKIHGKLGKTRWGYHEPKRWRTIWNIRYEVQNFNKFIW